MDRAPPTFDWNHARAFLVTAETGSFSAAARKLQMTQPTVGRQVAALEESLDLVLFERIGRTLSLTPPGRDLLEHLREMEASANLASLVATGRAQTVAGDVAISVTDIIAHHVMPHVVADLQRLAPDIRLRVISSNSLSDLQRRDADIAVRHVAPAQDDLIQRKLKTALGNCYAAQSYIDRHGFPQTKEDAKHATFVPVGELDELVPYLQNWGLPVTEANMRFLTTSGTFAWELALRGHGIITMTDDIARLFPDMVHVFTDLEPIEIPYWLTTHRELQSSKRIRLVFDRMAELLSGRDLPTGAVLRA